MLCGRLKQSNINTLIPSPEFKSLWAIRVDDNCAGGQDRQASATKVRDTGSFDGNHRLSGTIKLFSLHVQKTREQQQQVTGKVLNLW